MRAEGVWLDAPIDRRGFLAGAGVVGLSLASGASAGAIARAAARKPGARIPRTLEQAIRGPVIKRGAPGFLQAAHVYNERFDGVLPAAVARPSKCASMTVTFFAS